MSEEWRVLLYYPLGFLASFFFTLRFLIQWIKSEKAGVSYIDTSFWKISFIGNFLLFFHYVIQEQYPFAFIQTGNALISWRNLNMMTQQKPFSFQQTLVIFFVSFSIVLSVFMMLSLGAGTEWMRIPNSLIILSRNPGTWWHFVGFLGQGLFSSRFWIQWWMCEKKQKSELGLYFWWISLIGSVFSAVYFLKIADIVSFLNQSFGIIPYFRNLILTFKAPKTSVIKQ